MARRPMLALLAALCLSAPAAARESVARPNFLIIVADDLGYSDIGAFGGEIETPNLDALAARGLKLTGFHTAPTCSPTRSMLLTGLDHHEAGVGNMAELIAPNQQGRPGHEGYLRADNATLAELLGAGGYRTHYSGKWHLGVKPEQDPHNRGFQTSFALLPGGHNHFGLQIARAPGGPGYEYTENGQHVSTLPDTFYSSDYFATKLIDQFKAARAGPDGKKPFFAYLAFTAPHFPLQAPPETIAKYKGRYDGGYEVLREQRLKRQVALGLLDPKVVPHGFDLAPRWDSLSPEDKAKASRRMEVYAAMVDRLDQNVGRVIAALKESGELDNTVILFLADNGAEGSVLSERSMGMLNAVYAAADNRLENIGKASSYEALGPGWAEAATAPSWRVKAFQSEGGTRVVSILSGPGVRPAVGAAYTNVMDVVPTFLDLAHVPQPLGTLDGRAIKPIRGRSWADWLGNREAGRVYAPDQPIGEELFGGRALRQGDWKITDIGDGKWRLFNVAADPGETRDLAATEPARLAALAKAWDAYAGQVGVILPEPRQSILDRPSRR
ncbi:arylsulfatase [Novosphingobium album (ex Liu et al. 2023)]|uniref:Arylsulfatase n=1 Tax=Novosphingobium album (ex Liu et al. 2023) TaxID=3031130 RepID=A0ABT5WP21_9SPHN|nr:arylsulfatase [Novosphingobium album (ex Liu et al. 2023)]MDE8651491.1 arylsulfatase [Novosphingobium album (ex Liu et al. 2023)]